MIVTARAQRRIIGFLLMTSSLSAGILVPARSALAVGGITIGTTTTENATFALYNTGTTSGSVHWGSSGMLLDAGSSYLPALTTVNGTSQTYSSPSGTGTINNYSLSANENPPFSTTLPSSFGSSTVAVSASTNLLQNGDALTQTIGIAFNSGTYLQSATTGASGTAGVSFTALHANFVNNGGTSTQTIGAYISAYGYLNTSSSAPSFVELANTGTITINGVVTPFSVIEGWAWNGSTIQQVQAADGSSISGTSPTAGSGSFTFVDSFLPGGPISIPHGAAISITSYLTLVSDPGSLIALGGASDDTGLPPPTLGIFGGTSAPEPSTWIQLGTAMVMLVALGCLRRYRRISRNLPRLPGVSLVVLAGMTSLICGLAAPRAAEAGTITIDDLSSPISVSTSGFSTTSIGTNSFDQTATIQGTYFSTGGFPTPGTSATYWVVFQNPAGAQTDATELTITGLLSPNQSANTSVSVFFEGLITTPITPGARIYFIPQPSGYFNVAAYLASESAPGIPGDLSVFVVSPQSVPEPGSLATGAIGLLLAGLWVARRRRRRV